MGRAAGLAADGGVRLHARHATGESADEARASPAHRRRAPDQARTASQTCVPDAGRAEAARPGERDRQRRGDACPPVRHAAARRARRRHAQAAVRRRTVRARCVSLSSEAGQRAGGDLRRCPPGERRARCRPRRVHRRAHAALIAPRSIPSARAFRAPRHPAAKEEQGNPRGRSRIERGGHNFDLWVKE